MKNVKLEEYYPTNNKNGAIGILEFIIKDKNGVIVNHHVEKNIIKISAKEMLSHRLPSSQIWDTDTSNWIDSNIDPNEEFSARYMIFGASFNDDGTPLGSNDSRYYTLDTVTGLYTPVRLTPAAEYNGGLINSIPLVEPERGLKRVENINFQPSYQPAGSPLIDGTVRAVNNVLQLETTLKLDEYNGFQLTSSDFFTITEVALCGGKKFDLIGSCNLKPEQLFLEGSSGSTSDQIAIAAIANGTNVISIDSSEPTALLSMFRSGDQIRICNAGGTQTSYTDLDQVNPNYLVTEYSGGRDLILDRVPVKSDGTSLDGNIGIFKNSLRIFSHRILSSPVRKSNNFEILVRWNLIFN